MSSDIEELAKRNLHVFRVTIEEHGDEDVAFQGITRSEAKTRLIEWLRREPFATYRGERVL